MVQVVGDGGFYFGNPSSVFSVSQQYQLPILIVVMDNSGWGAVKASTQRVFPKGEAVAANEFESNLLPDADFSKIAEAFRDKRVDLVERFQIVREAVNGTMSSFFVAVEKSTKKTYGLKILDTEKTNVFEGRFKSLKKPVEGEIGMRLKLIGLQPAPGKQFRGEWIVSPARWLP